MKSYRRHRQVHRKTVLKNAKSRTRVTLEQDRENARNMSDENEKWDSWWHDFEKDMNAFEEDMAKMGHALETSLQL